MSLMTTPLVWAQSGGSGASTNPAATAYLALRRWCGGLTLSSPQPVPGFEGLWIFLGALGALVLIGLALQGAGPLLKQLCDVPGHIRLAQSAATRVWRAGRLVVAAIGFTVMSWTGALTLAFFFENQDRGRSDLLLLFRTRSRTELALEQGLTAALTPLRDLAGLADNLPALLAAIWLVFRFASGVRPLFVVATNASAQAAAPRFSIRDRRTIDGWATVVWTCAGLYAVYRIVAKAAGSAELPVGNCLVLETLIVPALMLFCDGFLLAWVLVELRDAGSDVRGETRLDPTQALKLMPAAALGCLLALPARYMATAVFLASQHVPSKVLATTVGRYIRWQLGWGLVDLQGASLVLVGAVGVIAWSRGSLAGTFHGYRRLLARETGRLVVVLAVAGLGCAAAAGTTYLLVFLLPPAGWVLAAADSYAHYATMPIGLWTLSALVTLAERSLPIAAAASDPLPALDVVAPAAEGSEEPDAEPIAGP
ncbi:MAG: hypothetical protein P4L85_22500 [Paludisphaera borealis]|uniref:hypothetical protein n=1 Tax=Paludisphaera borealis TaxID=1387353 RepID=UPI00284E325C|nr:hypothetical protein [Paludisphaera borealis]MDR3622138.1 hypothetical protein [Paludisphaera borealis]